MRATGLQFVAIFNTLTPWCASHEHDYFVVG